MPLHTSIISFIFVIGVLHSQCLDVSLSLDSSSEVDLEYRPWDHDETAEVWISLEGTNMKLINPVFRINVPGLSWLVMDNNQIGTIPPEAFRFMPDLTYISLAGNQISEIDPQAFSHLEKLQVIDLDRNPLSGFDSNVFSESPSLERLYLRNCELSSFDVSENLGNLSILYLSGNQLGSFGVDSNSALTHVYLNNNNLQLVSLSRLQSLIYVDLRGNRLERITSKNSPYTITRLGRRTYLNDGSSSLYIDNVPDLQYLLVSSNSISNIAPDTFIGVESLVHLDLTNNEITEVYPGTFNNLLQLENILLDSNRIAKITYRSFANLPNLKMISLKNNQISDIDEDAFTKLDSSANEVELFLDNNKIHTLRRTSFVGIKGLKHIGLSGNRIKIISSYAFVDLPNLESLVIENQTYDDSQDEGRIHMWNSEMELPEPKRGLIESHAFVNLPNLTSITIRGNVFTDIESEAFNELPKLQLLDLSRNGIDTLSSEAFSDLPMLEDLYLGGNSISIITPETLPKQLRNLDLAWNPLCPAFYCWNVSQLHQLEELNVSGITDRLKIEDIAELPKNLTVLVGKAQDTSIPVPCY